MPGREPIRILAHRMQRIQGRIDSALGTPSL